MQDVAWAGGKARKQRGVIMGFKEDVRASITPSLAQRMRNWARSMAGSSLGYAQMRWMEPAGGQPDGAPLPILAGEAEDTGKALETLPIRYRRAVEIYWMWGDSDEELTALARRCAVDYRTYANRVIDGHRLLQAELARAADAWRRRREESERAVSAVRGMVVS